MKNTFERYCAKQKASLDEMVNVNTLKQAFFAKYEFNIRG